MYRIFAFITSIFILLQLGCKGNNDVLATFNGGEIKRGELYHWLDSRKIDRVSALKNIGTQEEELKKIALHILTYGEAVKAGYDKTEESIILLDYFKNGLISREYEKRKRGNLSFKEEAARVKMIKLLIKDHKIINKKKIKLSDDELKKNSEQEMKLAKLIINLLSNKGSFEELAKKFSSDPSKNTGGDIGYIVQGSRSIEFVKAALSLKPGEFSKEPLRMGNAVYIIKVVEKTILTKDNFESIITNKNTAEIIKNLLVENASKVFQNDLVKAPDVKDHIKNAKFSNKNSVLFIIGNEEYKAGDIEPLLNYLMKMSSPFGKKIPPLDDNGKKLKAREIFMQKLLARDAVKNGFDKDPAFQNEWKNFKEAFIADKYKNDIIEKNIIVTENEIKNEYETNKDEYYSRHIKDSKKGAVKIIPYNEIKNTISHTIFKRKRTIESKKWNEEMLKKNNFSVNKSKLEGK